MAATTSGGSAPAMECSKEPLWWAYSHGGLLLMVPTSGWRTMAATPCGSSAPAMARCWEPLLWAKTHRRLLLMGPISGWLIISKVPSQNSQRDSRDRTIGVGGREALFGRRAVVVRTPCGLHSIYGVGR